MLLKIYPNSFPILKESPAAQEQSNPSSAALALIRFTYSWLTFQDFMQTNDEMS